MRGSSSPHRVAQGGHTSQSQTWDNEDLKIRHMEVSDPERGVLATFVRSGPFPRQSLFPEGLLKGSGSTASTIFSHRRFPRTRHSGPSDMKRERLPVTARLSLDLFDDAWTWSRRSSRSTAPSVCVRGNGRTERVRPGPGAFRTGSPGSMQGWILGHGRRDRGRWIKTDPLDRLRPRRSSDACRSFPDAVGGFYSSPLKHCPARYSIRAVPVGARGALGPVAMRSSAAV